LDDTRRPEKSKNKKAADQKCRPKETPVSDQQLCYETPAVGRYASCPQQPELRQQEPCQARILLKRLRFLGCRPASATRCRENRQSPDRARPAFRQNVGWQETHFVVNIGKQQRARRRAA
jgi:hypothetical protein